MNEKDYPPLPEPTGAWEPSPHGNYLQLRWAATYKAARGDMLYTADQIHAYIDADRVTRATIEKSLIYSPLVDRSNAVNLARNLLEGDGASKVTVNGIMTLAKAVCEMDAALLAITEQSSVNQEPVAWLVYLPSEEAQRVYDSQDDAGYIDDLTNHSDAQVQPLYLHPACDDISVAAAVAAEREACAQIADMQHFGGKHDDELMWTDCAAMVANAIRARTQAKEGGE